MKIDETLALKLGDRLKIRHTSYVAKVAQLTENYVRLEWSATHRYDVIDKSSPLWLSLELKK